MRPRLLDLFCGAGGAAMGYHRAGFEVFGIDVNPQPHYPFDMIVADAMDVPSTFFVGFDVIHASPPCQAYSSATPRRDDHPDLYVAVRDRLVASGVPWVVENVPGAPYRGGLVLCGSMFGLRIRRHRNFESSHLFMPPCGCRHVEQGQPLGVYGDGGGGDFPGHNGVKAHRKDFAELMGMPWATPTEIVLAVPPAYTEHIGRQLLAALEAVA